jgi:hypothetical protein
MASKAGQAEPGVRERQLAGIRAAMARPEVRARISAATIKGMARKFERELASIQAAWDAAPKPVRRRFLEQAVAETNAPVTRAKRYGR